jgi:uncharacterized membrane protein YkvA (DUF1232 family)
MVIFFNACNAPDFPATSSGYVDDVNVLAFGMNAEQTSSVLK